MQAVRRARTRPEKTLALLLRRAGVKFRQNVASLPGSPDFYVPAERLVVLVHGCFWHGHSRCRKGRSRPRTNRSYWRQKIARNQRRDRSVTRRLRVFGLSVYTVWECEIGDSLPKRLATRLHIIDSSKFE